MSLLRLAGELAFLENAVEFWKVLALEQSICCSAASTTTVLV